VFVAGIVLGDAPAPYKREIERFHSALASLGEIVAFVVLGLAVNLSVLIRLDVWLPGVIIGLALALIIRPILVGLCLAPAGLTRNERAFVLFAGLKGAVPILLGTYILAGHVPGATRLYGIVVVVVIFSVVVQGSLVPAVVLWLRLPVRTVSIEPWALGVRLRDEPAGVHQFTISPGSPADGTQLPDLEKLPGHPRISIVVRDSQLLVVTPHTRLKAGDHVTVTAEPSAQAELEMIFSVASDTSSPAQP
jgi:cell volume regulation protein A